MKLRTVKKEDPILRTHCEELKEKTENFVVKYSENNKYKNQEMDIDKLKELFVMINLTKV